MNVQELPQKELVALYPGDGTLTRRILNRCRKAGIKVHIDTEAVRIGRRRWGRKTLVYHVPSLIHDEELARRDAEIRKNKEGKKLKEEKEKELRAARRANELSEMFPQLPTGTIEFLACSGKRIYLPNQIGYQYHIGTKSYWKQLGFAVNSEPNGIVVKGQRLFDTYSSDRLVPRSSRMTVERLKAQWLAKYDDEQLVLAQAIRIANRLQKVKKNRSFYDVKDRWIKAHQDQLTEGRIARVETRTCWGCDGSGSDGLCYRCDGIGVYSSRTLYEHSFEIAGQRFVFHSYIRPQVVSEERAEDSHNYGRPFAADELPCPPQSVILSLIESMMASDEH